MTWLYPLPQYHPILEHVMFGVGGGTVDGLAVAMVYEKLVSGKPTEFVPLGGVSWVPFLSHAQPRVPKTDLPVLYLPIYMKCLPV